MQKTGWRGWGCEILVGVYIVSFGREGGVWGFFCLVLGVGFFLLSFVFKNKKHRQFFLASVLSIQVTITRRILSTTALSAAASLGKIQAQHKLKHGVLPGLTYHANVCNSAIFWTSISGSYVLQLIYHIYMLHSWQYCNKRSTSCPTG